MYAIKELSSKIGICSKAVFLGDSFKYLVYPGQESDAQKTVDASNKHMMFAICVPRKAASHA